MENRGFSLLEVLVVIGIIGIITAIAIPNYNNSMDKAKIEKQTKELHSVIVTARLAAMQDKRPGAIFFGPKQYIYRVYTSFDHTTFDKTASLTSPFPGWKQVNTMTMPYDVKKGTATLSTLNITSDIVAFDIRGFTNDYKTLVINATKSYGGDNCIVVHTARTKIGRRMENASTCTAR
jgi:prepilin-type N-terminal cleavage/methylation domain-containing protein